MGRNAQQVQRHRGCQWQERAGRGQAQEWQVAFKWLTCSVVVWRGVGSGRSAFKHLTCRLAAGLPLRTGKRFFCAGFMSGPWVQASMLSPAFNGSAALLL